MLETLLNKLNSRDASIGILGLGYVGLPLALCFAEKNCKVKGFDVNIKKIDDLKNSQSFINTISNKRIKESIKSGNFSPTNNSEDLKDCDVYIICVPTPLTETRDPDLSFINSAVDVIAPLLEAGNLVSLESTTYPGTTEEILLPKFIKKQLNVGEDFFLVYSPEREDPGNKEFNNLNIPKIVGGITPNCTKVGTCLYSILLGEVIAVSNTKTAEMTKLLENIHRSVNIGLMNELKPLTSEMGIDIYEVIEAAATKPFGFVPYYPGPGLGGHCIPIDPFYLTWKAKSYGMNTKFIELAGEINSSMPNYVLNKIIDTLNNIGLPVSRSKILILGLAYKADVADCRESPSIAIINQLLKLKASITLSDPLFKEDFINKIFNNKISITNIDAEKLKKFDLIVLLTKHSCFNYELISSQDTFIIDTRGSFPKAKNIINA